MPLILPVKDKSPVWGSDCFIAENATIVGDVVMGDNCSVWFNAVIRGDVHYIKIGNNTNIQDGAVIHCSYQYAPTNIGNNVSIGHNALVHGCTLHDNVLVGMGAIVMDHAIVEPFVIIAAGSVVLEKTICDSGFLYAGAPAKKIKPITDAQREMLTRLPNNYIMYSGWFKE
ncbi:Carbonic anhydrase or acetyltransferase, isoleucine patch superfamily [Mucilaginibacter mallensis]|uniref:Carbonic anhydrase or acetyltransferase, isoleucine patch superfamily n=1 Tax=Mucilaginibacter mallensis TaxID=652787 RepID=A0A1H2C382_MUCMA|nr:gamma carbonic anhydrase family protein [Mucilaginibacter mallensis]SDT64747.1 Carbonic anhydrase or acetyltransferase, isoleucine patch superfamily [Mucilaginibacter mallensis]